MNSKSLTMKPLLLITLGVSLTLLSCKKDEDNTPTPVNEEELITTVKMKFISPGSDTTVFSFIDLDGDGGNVPVITNGNLKPSTIYDVLLEFWNEAENPAEDITEEVRTEGDEHQVFF